MSILKTAQFTQLQLNLHDLYNIIQLDILVCRVNAWYTCVRTGIHSYKLYVKPASLNSYKHSFFIRIVKLNFRRASRQDIIFMKFHSKHVYHKKSRDLN